MNTRPRCPKSWTPAQRLAHRIKRDPLSGCWIWQGRPNAQGYGQVTIRPQRTQLAHRFAWGLRHGPIPRGAFLCHRCDERRCVNPDHLFLGTHATNMADRKAKRAAMTAPLGLSPVPGAAEDRAHLRLVYRGLELMGEVTIRPLRGAAPESDTGEG
jgi:hypothetical protein